MAPHTETTSSDSGANGAAMAAVFAAGIGSLAMGMFVLANEAGIFTAPSLYGPAGGLSGRSTLAVVVWLVAWGAMHMRWQGRAVASGPVMTWTLILIAIAVVAMFPPLWALL